jgi:hypothetical protein
MVLFIPLEITSPVRVLRAPRFAAGFASAVAVAPLD